MSGCGGARPSQRAVEWSVDACDSKSDGCVSLSVCPVSPRVMVTRGGDHVALWDVGRGRPELLFQASRAMRISPGYTSSGSVLDGLCAIASSRDICILRIDCADALSPKRKKTAWRTTDLTRAGWAVDQLLRAPMSANQSANVVAARFVASDRASCKGQSGDWRARLVVVLDTVIYFFVASANSARPCGAVSLCGVVLRPSAVAIDIAAPAQSMQCLTTAGIEVWSLPTLIDADTERCGACESISRPSLLGIQGLLFRGHPPHYPPAGLVGYCDGVAVLPWPVECPPRDMLAHTIAACSLSIGDATKPPTTMNSLCHPLSTRNSLLLLRRLSVPALCLRLPRHSMPRDPKRVSCPDPQRSMVVLDELRTAHTMLMAELAVATCADECSALARVSLQAHRQVCFIVAQHCAVCIASGLLVLAKGTGRPAQSDHDDEEHQAEGLIVDVACKWFELSGTSVQTATESLELTSAGWSAHLRCSVC